METQIIVQLIETGGILLIAISGFITYLVLTKRKKRAEVEVNLLKDCLYFQLLVNKYKNHLSDIESGNNLNTFRRELTEEYNYSPSSFSFPGKIRSRLIELNEYTEEVDKYIESAKVK